LGWVRIPVPLQSVNNDKWVHIPSVGGSVLSRSYHPNPLSVEITNGEADIETVCKDVLSLTKLNYNACIYGDGVPVTLRFANSIGEILTAGPTEGIEVLPFKHYI